MNIDINKVINSLNGEIKKFLKKVLNNGWEIDRIKKHIILKKNGMIFAIPKTPSDKRSISNMYSNLNKLQRKFMNLQ